jgi:dienelactone hydrolase
MQACALIALMLLFHVARARAEINATNAALFLDFRQAQSTVRLTGARDEHTATNGWLHFNSPTQFAEIDFSRQLDGITTCSIGGWFFLQRRGEQVLFGRGHPETAPGGERTFQPAKDWVNFFLGTDQHGFLMGCINGNSRMPFPLVTLSDVAEGQWHQLVLVKNATGGQQFYHNGTLVHTDADSEHAGHVWPFRDTAAGAPVRLAVPFGGRIGEAWVFPRELSATEIQKDFQAKRARFAPALPVERIMLREMDARPAAHLWPEPITGQIWPRERERIRAGVMKLLGPFPTNTVPLDPRVVSETDCGSYVRKKISIQVQPGDRMPAWLLVPKELKGRVPAIICFYGTSSGAGKDTTVGLSGAKPGSPPVRNRAFAIDMVEAGFVALAPDFLRDGERMPPSGRPYDTSDFYARFPEWSCVGKDIWDTMRAVDYLETLPFVAADRIGMVGHSYGGHTTIFAAALEPRIKAAFASGPVSDFRGHGMHWAVPKGAGNSQSLPNLRPYMLNHSLPIPAEFYEWTALIAPRPLWVNQAVGERRPHEEENHAAVRQVYEALGVRERVHYAWCAGDHDFPPAARAAAVEWFRRWFAEQ